MQKILAVYNPNSGGSYHRVKLWSEFVDDVTLVEELTEELVSNCDILYIHWNSKTAVTQLSIWREKYKFKIIADIDDVWRLSPTFEGSVFLSQHLCLLADHVICSTEYLVQDIMEWNKNVTVIPNLIPYDYDQFKAKDKPVRDKLRVGIGGSISHFEDYMSLKGTIKRLEKSDWFNKSFEFAIIGYDHLDWRWQKVASMFKDVKLFKYKSTEDYMSLYDQLDIMLLPLLDTEINKGRSNLKILECLSKNVYPVIGEGYLGKHEKNKYFQLLKNYDAIKHFTDRSLIKLTVNTLRLNFIGSYENLCVEPRMQIFNAPLTPLESKVDLYSITYSNEQDAEYKRINNKINSVAEKSYLFEYNKILEYVDSWETYSKDSYLAFFSHKFPHKTGFYKKYVEEILDNEDSDVVIFCKQMTDYLFWSETQHKGLINILRKVCDKLGLDIKGEKPTVYSNFFAAKVSVYKEYADLLRRAIDIMETDPEIKELCWKDANYTSGLDATDLKNYTGLDYYTFHTFILERLISVWVSNKGLTYAVYT